MSSLRQGPAVFSLLLPLFFCLFFLADAHTAFSRATPVTSATILQEGQVKWIHDGDSIEVAGIGTVRLLGIDAPERSPSGRDAFYIRQGVAPATLRRVHREGRDFLIAELKGQIVSLEYGPRRKDKYGRLLAYVFLSDGRLVNTVMIEKGYAAVYRRFEFHRKNDFLEAEARARKAELGLWHRQ